ncbi:MAG TPA: hypothetical protein VJI15_04730 [Candidatus Nanoarchaeia archaeon]|nr:hypothetical protein [Candidatus Nanoarchaeia archaeon]
MGKTKYLKEIEQLFAKSPVVQASSISRLLKSKKKVKQYDRHVLRNLVKKGKIHRLMKGYYTSHNDPSLAVFCFQPAYLGGEDALSRHNLWEQETIPVIFTTRHVRRGLRKVMGTNVLLRMIPRELFFGVEYHTIGEMILPYSDKEKTVLDRLYFRKNIDKVEVKGWLKHLDQQRLKKYVECYPQKFQERIKFLL